MKRSYLFALKGLALIILFSISCSTQVTNKITENEKKAIISEIETIVNNFFDPNTLSYETHTGLRADKEGYIMGGDGKIQYTDYSSYHEGMKSSFAHIQKFTEAKPIVTYVYVLSKDAATCTTEFKSKFLTTTGDTIVNNGCWTFVFKKFEDGWKVIQENGTHTRNVLE